VAKAKAGTAADPATTDKLKRERAGTYRTADGRFTIEQSSSGWMLLDAEQANELGLPLARGPFATLDAAREAIPEARSGPAPSTGVEPRRAARKPAVVGPPARERADSPRGKAGSARRAPRRPDPAQLVIRELRLADGDALRALWQEAGFRSVGDDDKSLARLARRNPGLVLVATESGRIVGSALGAWDGRRGWIYHVATAAGHRRRGVATRLIAEVERGLRDLDCPRVNVLVRDENDDDGAFWTSLGYDAGRSRQYVKDLADG
jgi:ribosomal protein S18 acetylase RimI-like enzyme